MPPRELVPVDTSYREPPTVTVLEPRRPAEFEYAEPSQVMGFFSRIWRRTVFLIKAATVIALVGTYPALTLASHTIDDSEIELVDGFEWAVDETRVSVTLIAREIEGPGWAADRPKWHPQARLSAMPAWQEGIAGATSDYTRLLAAQTGDEDLTAAARLLAPEGEAMRDRLSAAAEALAHYDRRAESGHANPPDGDMALGEKLQLAIGWAKDSRTALANQAHTPAAWPASYEDIRTFYTAKARAHVAHEVLRVALLSENDAITARGLTETKTEALALWRRAAVQKPLFVTNQTGNSALFGNDLTGMAFLMDEAAAATQHLADQLSRPVSQPENGKSAELASVAPQLP